MTRVSSFDVFDTVVTRAAGSPQSLLYLLGRVLRAEGIVSCPPEAFADARLDAELRAYRAAKALGEEVRLAAIHEELARALGLPEETAERIRGEELALERRLLRAVPGARERVARARARGEAVAFVSDTPLPGAFLRDELRRHGLLEDGDVLLASSECGTNKDDGAIYRELAQSAGVPPGEIVHEGNSQRHDLAAAERAGLRTAAFLEANLDRYEASLDRAARRTGGLSAALAGASRLARLRTEARTAAERAVRDVAAGVVAPLLVAYVAWVLREARRRGVTTLWFLARDGQVLLDLARILAPRLGIEIDLRYLLASRQAWNLPAFARGAHADLAWIWDRSDGLSARTLLARVGLEPRDLAAELAACGLPEPAWTRPLRRAELASLRPLAASEAFRARVLAAARGREPLLRRYLEQEGVTAARRAALVELAGHGNLQESLTALLRAAGAEAPPCFYFAVMPDGRRREMAEMVSYLGEQDSAGLVPGFAVIALEAFCAADHGTLVGFEDARDRVRPVLEPTNEPVAAWGLDVLRRTVAEFARELVLDADLVDAGADVRACVTDNLRTFWRRPTRAEAAAWGEFPWEDGFGAETRYLPLARSHSWSEVVGSLLTGRIPRRHRAAWPAGSLALTPPVRRLALRASAKLGRGIRGQRRA